MGRDSIGTYIQRIGFRRVFYIAGKLMKMETGLRTRRRFALLADQGGGEGGVRDQAQRAKASARNDNSGSQDHCNVHGNLGRCQ